MTTLDFASLVFACVVLALRFRLCDTPERENERGEGRQIYFFRQRSGAGVFDVCAFLNPFLHPFLNPSIRGNLQFGAGNPSEQFGRAFPFIHDERRKTSFPDLPCKYSLTVDAVIASDRRH
ncbi:hypothetical protein BV898_10118 [Hypsibius exemplaris]|uniref:Secreted protein n=1 Tax=Hypsibius exemplaris TaxID=2072580 RepID=A0A1W0WKM5_HYPEX|nr:hypothetical protein BV898_10118 [Hypsibius exemplaris]